MNVLVAPLAKKISDSHKRKIVVLPLLCDDQGNLQLGVWLAKQISLSLASSVPGLELIDASAAHVPLASNSEPRFPRYDPKKVIGFAKKAGAEIVVTGSFSPFGDGLGISLSALKRDDDKHSLADSNGKLALTGEISTLLLGPLRLSPPADGIYRAGWGGVGIPTCSQCPDPAFPTDERSRGREGRVVLEAVIGADGIAHEISVKQTTSLSFSKAAISTVEKWKFRPALGPDKKPVAVRVPVEVTFRLGSG